MSGFNTDVIGFEALFDEALSISENADNKAALIFGSGGASKAVQYVLKKKGIKFQIVTRNCKTRFDIGYSEINDRGFYPYSLIINTTPVGMYPNVDDYLELPFSILS